MPGYGCTGDKVHLSQVQGEYMKFSYTGENAALYGFKGSSCGSVDLYIDNIRYESINLENGGSLKLTKLFDAKKFVKEGTHVIKLINADGKKLMIDRVEIK